VITAGFVMGIKKANSYVEGVYVPPAGLSANGLTATGCVRGIRLDGLDFTTGDTSLATTHLQDEPVSCIIHPALQQILVNALQGVGDMATGGTDFVLGAGAAGTITIKRNNGSALGFLRHNGTSVQYSDAGSTWTNLSDISASDIVKVSSNDTTPGYLNGKLVAGSNITLTEGNDGGNETLTITSASANSGITTHIIYTPGYLTGGAAPTSNYLLWLGTTAGSFQVTIDGTARSITGINFSSGVASMSDVASKIQTALRAVTSSTETVTWSGTRFVITSASTSSTSAVSVLTAGVSGTDISGATAGDPNMDSDTGNGTATAAILNPAADVGKVGFLDSTGRYDIGLTVTELKIYSTALAGEAIDGTTTPVPVHISDGTNGRTTGSVYKSDANDSTNAAQNFIGFTRQNIAAGLAIVIQQGIVGGFSGLTRCSYYYVQDAVGTIGLTQGTAEICVGKAISATEIDTDDRYPGMSFVSTVNASGTADGSTITAPSLARIVIIQVTTPAPAAGREGIGEITLTRFGRTSGTFQYSDNGADATVTATWSGSTITLASSLTGVSTAMAGTAVGSFYR
jgi:hypothetical protein